MIRLPFSWGGVSLHATGATTLRARLSPAAKNIVAVQLADPAGAPVAEIEAVESAEVDVRQLGASAVTANDTLFGLDWTSVALPAADPAGVALLGADHHGVASMFPATAEPETVLAAPQSVGEALDLVQSWLADDREARLVLLTALAAGPDVTDLTTAGIWGLTRSAMSEHGDRFALVDLDGTAESLAALPSALRSTEPELLLRKGSALAPRLTRTPEAVADAADVRSRRHRARHRRHGRPGFAGRPAPRCRRCPAPAAHLAVRRCRPGRGGAERRADRTRCVGDDRRVRHRRPRRAVRVARRHPRRPPADRGRSTPPGCSTTPWSPT